MYKSNTFSHRRAFCGIFDTKKPPHQEERLEFAQNSFCNLLIISSDIMLKVSVKIQKSQGVLFTKKLDRKMKQMAGVELIGLIPLHRGIGIDRINLVILPYLRDGWVSFEQLTFT